MLLSMAGDEGRAGRSSKSGKGGASSKTKASGKGAKTSRGASASAVKSDPMPTEEESFAVLGLDDVPPGSYKDDLHPNLRIPPKKKSRAYRREGRISKDRVSVRERCCWHAWVCAGAGEAGQHPDLVPCQQALASLFCETMWPVYFVQKDNRRRGASCSFPKHD